jgi:hypothetical protein
VDGVAGAACQAAMERILEEHDLVNRQIAESANRGYDDEFGQHLWIYAYT